MGPRLHRWTLVVPSPELHGETKPQSNSSCFYPARRARVYRTEPVSQVWVGVEYGPGVRLKRHQGGRY